MYLQRLYDSHTTPDESKLGDVLVFRTDDDDSETRCTTVASPYTGKVYYTLTSDGVNSEIWRGKGKSVRMFGESTHVATVSSIQSVAQRTHANGPFAGSGSKLESIDPEEKFDEKDALEVDKELEACTEESQLDNKSMSTASKEAGHSLVQRGPSKDSKNEQLLMIHFGRGASHITKTCLRMTKTSVIINHARIEYSWNLDKNGQPALSVPKEDNRQVVWSQPPQVGTVDHKLITVHPASVTFFPEVRPFLDAVILSLVIWEKKQKGTWLAI